MGRNRDEWVANGAPHGLCAHASDWATKSSTQSPDFGPTRRAEAFSGGLRRCNAGP
ncbi:MAG: hypothetical protein LBV61_04635 [Burkholderiaceae bacterium]|nr:hypothetical protein [Burkholderiaceae bacterium]